MHNKAEYDYSPVSENPEDDDEDVFWGVYGSTGGREI